MTALTEGPLLWFLNRGSGLVLLVLLTLTVVLGVLAMGGRPGQGVPRFVTQRLHRNLGLVSVVAVVVHIATAVLDTFVDIRWWHAVVPWGSAYEPLWVGLGTAAVDVILVVVLSSLLRTRLSHRTWRVVHLGAWLAWGFAIAHTIGIGTDLKELSAWAVVPSVACACAVLAAAGIRIAHLVRDPHPVTRPLTYTA